MIVITLFMLAGSLLVVAAISSLVMSQLRVMKELSLSSSAYALSEGALEEVVYRHKKGMSVSASETLTEGGVTITTDTTNIAGGIEVLAQGNFAGRMRNVQAVLLEGDGVSFNFGVQTHNGGIIMEGNSYIDGNVYSNGPIEGRAGGGALSDVFGTIVSAGPTGSVESVYATGSIYAHFLDDSKTDGNAYAKTITNTDIAGDAYADTLDFYSQTNLGGTPYPSVPDMATSSLPIPDSLIDSWKTYAENAGVYAGACPYTINSDRNLGPIKIPCDVTITGNSTDVNIQGAVWITGNLTFKLSPTMHIDDALGNKSVPIVVDNPANRLTSSKVVMQNGMDWEGNAGGRSYLLVVSGNTSAETGGTEYAIDLQNTAGGELLVYAGHGEIRIGNHADLTMITAWRVRLANGSSVQYDRGIANSVFTSGPGGGYTIDSWKEVE